MNLLTQFLGYWIRFPAEIKGMKFGKKSFIAPGYDFIFNQMKGITVGDYVIIGKNAWLQTIEEGTISIGNGTSIGRSVVISALQSIDIGNKCLISYHVSILDHDHNFHDLSLSPVESKYSQPKNIIIKDNCFIGAHSFILKGVQLGEHCVVGSNSVVTSSFPPHSFIAGNPARLIRTL